jgi:two-component system LytT family response regulator
MLKALLVDDEVAAIRSLELLLSQFCKDVEVIGTAHSGDEALVFIQNNKPDLIFLDIEMPRGSGFDFIEKCTDRDFEIIFITAYDNYALKAFKYSAIDYILKPIDIDELISSVEKVTQLRKANYNSKNKYFALFENLKSIIPNKMVVRVSKNFEYIDLTEVQYFETKELKALVHFVNGTILQIDDGLETIEKQLEEKNFFRIHSKYLVNSDQIKKITKGNTPSIEIINGIELPLDPSAKDSLIQRISSINNNK